MVKKSLISIIVATALVGCGGGDNDELNGNSRGIITITSGDLIAGATLSALVTDADGIKNDTLVYAWSTGAAGTSYTITEADEGSIISVSARYTDEAGITEGVGASTGVILPTLDVTASVVKGPVSGASCELFAVSANGVAVTPAQGSAISGESGSVTFANVHFEGAGLVSCSGGTYKDESTGATLNAPMLRAVVAVVEGSAETPAPSYVVSPLTEMAVQAAGADLNTFAAKAAVINGRFGIRFDTTKVLPTEVGVTALGAAGADNADRYGSALALLSQLDADNAGKDMAALIADLAADVADGSFSEANLTAFETAQTNLQTTSAVAADVDSDLLNLMGSAIGYNNTPVAAIIEGALSGTVKNTATAPLMGTVTVVDPNFEEDAILVQSNVALDYGTFSISAQGAWSYTVNVDNETVASLEVGNSVYDTVTITSIDGTTETIEVRVAALTQMVKLSNTGSSTGQIRFNVNDLRKGKLSATFLKEASLGSDGAFKDAYIAIYGSGGSNAQALIDLRLQGNQTDSLGNAIAPRFLVRNTEAATYPGDMVTAPFVEGEFYELEITWDVDAAEQLTLTANGEVIGGGSFVTAAAAGDWFADGVKSIQFRFGDNGSTIPFGSFFVDNIKVYSDVAGTVSVFSDDFESYNEGNALTETGTLYSTSVYAEVVVYDSGDGTVEPTPATFLNLTGAIASDEATATGAVSVFDPDEGEASLAPASFATTYGSFSILADGSWTYTLDTANATIAALIQGESETETISIMSYDGTMADLIISINGVGGTTVTAKAAVIRDTDASDTGELRYDIDAALSGRLEATFTRTETGPTAYIALLNTSGSTSSGRSIVDMNISSSAFSFRDQSIELPEGLVPTPGTLQTVIITWSAATATDRPTVNVTIDGVALPAFTSGGSAYVEGDANSGGVGGVSRVQFRFGSNSGVAEATDTFTIKSFEVFSDIDGTTSIFDEDFSGFSVGDSLDTDNPNSPYNSSTSEAVVELLE